MKTKPETKTKKSTPEKVASTGAETSRTKGKEVVGKVVSTKMNKTIVVLLERFMRHPLYKKPVRRSKRVAAHIEGIEVAEGDMVRIREMHTMSKTKHFQVIERVR